MVLAEMRDFLQAVQQINLPLAHEDFKQAARWARKMGKASQAAVPT